MRKTKMDHVQVFCYEMFFESPCWEAQLCIMSRPLTQHTVDNCQEQNKCSFIFSYNLTFTKGKCSNKKQYRKVNVLMESDTFSLLSLLDSAFLNILYTLIQ